MDKNIEFLVNKEQTGNTENFYSQVNELQTIVNELQTIIKLNNRYRIKFIQV